MPVHSRLVAVAAFNSPVEADLARSQLEEAGIPSVLADEATSGNFWVLVNAVGGVKLQVFEQDLARAREILNPVAEMGDEPPQVGTALAATGQGWRCPRCGSEVEPGFEVCWKCGTARDGTVDPDFAPDEEDNEPEPATQENAAEQPGYWRPPPEPSGRTDHNPFSSPHAPLHDDVPTPEPPPEVTDPGDEAALRALRAAVIGLVVCPIIFNIVSVYMLFGLAVRNNPLSRRGSIRYYIAWATNILAAPLLLLGAQPLANLAAMLRRAIGL
ncbi:MAG TPA: DUF2007 domain-containing protein [Pirellulales bacterium]|jgi:hypothetical protein|nr:DUF2007 domain-containing protein [Pirellulales bacterium]